MQELRFAWRAFVCRLDKGRAFVGSAPAAQLGFAAAVFQAGQPWPACGRLRLETGEAGQLCLVRWPDHMPFLAVSITGERPLPCGAMPVMLSLSFSGPAAETYLDWLGGDRARPGRGAMAGFVLLSGATDNLAAQVAGAVSRLPGLPDLDVLARTIADLGAAGPGQTESARGGIPGYPQ